MPATMATTYQLPSSLGNYATDVERGLPLLRLTVVSTSASMPISLAFLLRRSAAGLAGRKRVPEGVSNLI
ncbi:hypothetical protein [Streptomyces mirabilis]|uniref:hypothetical protein n=2 Tax=Streptomyces mirabilis TaxID=68239 RepID=UPI00364D692D